MLLSASGFHLSVFDTKIKYEQLLVRVNFGFKRRENYQLLDKVKKLRDVDIYSNKTRDSLGILEVG
jgi:hypothetical protein